MCQLLAIGLPTFALTGSFFSAATWYSSLVALAVNTQLLEPYFPRPVDILGNSVVALLMYFLAAKVVAAPGWHALAVMLILAALASAIALVLGAGRFEGRFVSVARFARVLAGPFRANAIYSATFWLGLVEASGGITRHFWSTALAWLLVFVIGAVNWQALWATARGGPVPATAEGIIGPSRLLVAASTLPPVGTSVRVLGGGHEAQGTILARIRRAIDVWGSIHLPRPDDCERLLGASALTITAAELTTGPAPIGVVDAASTHAALVFSPTLRLRVGDVVAVQSLDALVLYQLSRAEVVESHVKGGSQLHVQARASQLGVFDAPTLRLSRHRWLPEPGAPVTNAIPSPAWSPADNRFLLGHIIGTNLPVSLDCEALCEGHLAILGMTRMGKTTLAVRLAKFLAANRVVIVMDQTGEYRTKHGIAAFDAPAHDSMPGLSVFEPVAGKAVPDEGLTQLKLLANKGYAEYKTGVPVQRVLLVDEAHQFVPEPALLGFGAPGRESAITFGMHAMQVRKYGLALILISQRTAVVAKNALSQCENVIAFKSVDQTGLDYLEAVLGLAARDMLPSLRQGEAMVCGPAVSSDSPVAITVSDHGGPAA